MVNTRLLWVGICLLVLLAGCERVRTQPVMPVTPGQRVAPVTPVQPAPDAPPAVEPPAAASTPPAGAVDVTGSWVCWRNGQRMFELVLVQSANQVKGTLVVVPWRDRYQIQTGYLRGSRVDLIADVWRLQGSVSGSSLQGSLVRGESTSPLDRFDVVFTRQ